MLMWFDALRRLRAGETRSVFARYAFFTGTEARAMLELSSVQISGWVAQFLEHRLDLMEVNVGRQWVAEKAVQNLAVLMIHVCLLVVDRA